MRFLKCLAVLFLIGLVNPVNSQVGGGPGTPSPEVVFLSVVPHSGATADNVAGAFIDVYIFYFDGTSWSSFSGQELICDGEGGGVYSCISDYNIVYVFSANILYQEDEKIYAYDTWMWTKGQDVHGQIDVVPDTRME